MNWTKNNQEHENSLFWDGSGNRGGAYPLV